MVRRAREAEHAAHGTRANDGNGHTATGRIVRECVVEDKDTSC